jgi:hypothetical protein
MARGLRTHRPLAYLPFACTHHSKFPEEGLRPQPTEHHTVAAHLATPLFVSICAALEYS